VNAPVALWFHAGRRWRRVTEQHRSPNLMTRAFLILFCGVVALAASDKTTLRKIWASPHYTTNSIPSIWRPSSVPLMATNVKQFEQFSLQTNGLSISNFFARYGLPNRYLTTQRTQEWDFAIYDLPSKHTVALYVPKPPASGFGACVIIKPDGDLLRLIK
jgi:hypothetical protein